MSETKPAGWNGRGRLQQLVAELERQKASRIDFVTDTRHLGIRPVDKGVLVIPMTETALQWLPVDGLPLHRTALNQLGAKMTPPVPGKFLQDLVDQRPIRAAALLDGLMTDKPESRLIRCLDGSVRAILSDKYRMIDNYDLAFAALDVARGVGGEVVEASLSESHMRIKFTSRAIFDAVAVTPGAHTFLGSIGHRDRTGGHPDNPDLPGGPGTVHPLVTVSNSETGQGGLDVSIGLLQSICTNLVIIEHAVSRVHVGERMEQGLFTMETVMADNRVLFMKVRDVIKGAFDSETFKRLVAVANKAQTDVIRDPRTALANLAEDNGLSEDGRDRIMEYFLRDYDQTRYGLGQAVARCAQDIDEPESATMMEELAGTIIRDGKAVRS